MSRRRAVGLAAALAACGGDGPAASSDVSSGTSSSASAAGTTGAGTTGGTTEAGVATTGGAGSTGAAGTTGTTGEGTTGAVATTGGSGVDTCAEVPSYEDADGDGYGDDGSEQFGCAVPPGRAPIGGDCDDGDPLVHPGKPETCGLGDDDCDGTVDEYDPIGNTKCGPCSYLVHDGRAYAFCQGALAWGLARQDCLARGMDLAIVAAVAEHTWIAAQPPVDSGLWFLGARDTVVEGKFRWTDGVLIDPLDPRWAAGEPDNKGSNKLPADCLALISPGVAPGAGAWADEDCSRKGAWICEGDLP